MSESSLEPSGPGGSAALAVTVPGEVLTAGAAGSVEDAPAEGGWIQRFVAALWPEEKALLIALFFTAFFVQLFAADFAPFGVIDGYVPMLATNFAALFALSRVVIHRRVRRPNPAAWLNAPDIAHDMVLVRACLFLFGYLLVYTHIKAQIPIFNTATYDAFFMELERDWLGDPVGKAALLREYPLVIKGLDRLYHHAYIFFALSAFLLFINNEPRALRLLFVTMGITYVLGVLFTAVWPTLGPCFVDRDAYAWLKGTRTFNSQQALAWWYGYAEAYRTGQVEEFSPNAYTGIAAFPSLHVGHCLVVSLVAWRFHRWLLWLYVPATIGTYFATVVFGWHWFLDGVGVVPFVAAAWFLAKWMIYGSPRAVVTAPPRPA